jgi:RND family efflux transporter MFP subunit
MTQTKSKWVNLVNTDFKKSFKKLGLPLAIIGAGLLITMLLIFTKPKAQKQAKEEEIPLVEVVLIQKTTTPLIIKAQGQMEPAHALRILAEVSGKILSAHPQFTNGGVVKKDDILIKIDMKEYELALAQKKSLLAAAKLNLSLETAHQEVAADEFSRRQNTDEVSDNAKGLATRTQFLEKAKAEYAAALAEVKRAELALLKTTIRAPINGMLSKANVHVGEFIFAQSEVGVLYGTDEFKAEVNIPIHELAHLKFADQSGSGSKAIISQLSMNDTVIEREGVVSKLLPDLGSLGHMARVVIVIKDPLGIQHDNSLPLLAKAKVNVAIEGSDLKDVFLIPRSALTQDDAILVVDNESKVSRLVPQIIRREKDAVYAVGSELLGARVIVTKTNATKIGQQVRLAKKAIVLGNHNE